jgi:hypothetical protein
MMLIRRGNGRVPSVFGAAFCALVLAAVLLGCGGGATVDSFHPEDLTARESLEKALNAWKNGGQASDSLTAGKTTIRLVDERWKEGAKLTSFEIAEPLDVDGPPQFPVKLTLDGQGEPVAETYVVFGKDPLWIWTKAEFDRSGGM